MVPLRHRNDQAGRRNRWCCAGGPKARLGVLRKRCAMPAIWRHRARCGEASVALTVAGSGGARMDMRAAWPLAHDGKRPPALCPGAASRCNLGKPTSTELGAAPHLPSAPDPPSTIGSGGVHLDVAALPGFARQGGLACARDGDTCADVASAQQAGPVGLAAVPWCRLQRETLTRRRVTASVVEFERPTSPSTATCRPPSAPWAWSRAGRVQAM